MPPESATDQQPRAPSAAARTFRAVACGCLVGLLLGVGAEGGRVLIGRNLHVVVPGRIYRCAQPSRAALEHLVWAYGIRTVVNLRGCCPGNEWYLAECRATCDLDLAQEDVCLSAGRLPPVHEMRRLVEVLDRAEYPIVLHCRRGADRTGLVAAMVLLLHTDADLATARRQLGPRYGHVPIGRPANLQRFFDLYEEWLQERGAEHSPAGFRQWIEDGYCPGECRCRIEPLDPPAWVPVGKPFAFRVRVHNTSIRPWRLRPNSNAGIHGFFLLTDPGQKPVGVGRVGLFEAEVPPGGSIDLCLPLPTQIKPGRYDLFVDMRDEQNCDFYQAGSEPLVWELEVRSNDP